MIVTGLQILLTLFALFAVSRVILAFRSGTLSFRELIVWISIWSSIIVVAYYPQLTDILVKFTGLKRGIDSLVYISIVVLFYSTYRIYMKIEKIEQEITGIVRESALSSLKKKEKP